MTADSPLLFGRYQLLERVARGGMAEVFKAKSHGVEGFEKLVVLKRILPELAENQQFVDMFLNEARLSVALSHANIVQVFDLGREEDTYFIAMEYVPGMDFGQAIRVSRRTHAPAPVELCVYIGCEVARALDYAHRRKDAHGRPLGLVHRDISPQNVLLSYEGEVKVTDFGIAKARSTVESAGTIKGKYGYMSPEQAEGRAVDARADVYSLGVTLYEALAGRNPFHAPTADEVRRRALSGERSPLRAQRPDAPEALVDLIDRALSRDPDRRPQSAARMYEELTAVLHGLGRRVGPRDLSEWLRGLRDAGSEEMRASVLPEPEVTSTAGMRRSSTPSLHPHDELRDVTLLALAVNAEEELAAEVLEALSHVMVRHGGVALERSNTRIVMAFGLEHPDGRDTFTATRLALRLQSAALRAAQAKEPIATVGASVHAAQLTVRGDGTLDRDARFEDALLVVNALANSARNRVLGSDTVAVAGADHFEWVSVAEGAVLVKGELAPARRRVSGRREQFKLFGELLAKAANDGAQVITVSGVAGVGKTRFLEEVVYRLRKMGHPVTWFKAQCLFHDREVPLAALQAMLRAVLGVEETDTDAVVNDRARKLREFGLSPDEMLAAGSLMGVVNVGGDTSAATARALRGALKKLIQGASRGTVTVFAWDCAEHMDEPTRARVMDLLRDAQKAPVMFVVAGRPGRPWPWENLSAHHRLSLGALDDEESRALVALRLGNVAPPEELFEALQSRSHGNAFFLEEYLKSFQQSENVTVHDGEAVFVPPEVVEVPRTVRGLAASTLSHLGPIERRLLQVASVFGVSFHHDAVYEASEMDPVQCNEALEGLTAAGLLAPAGPGESRFASAIVHDVLYSAIAPDVKKALHRAVAAVLEAHAGEHLPMLVERIAFHYRAAGDREHAAALRASLAD